MLGVAAAETACRRQRRPVPGELRGASVEVGHRLRGNPQAIGRPGRIEYAPVVIVGAGPSGLAAAWRLTRLGGPRAIVLDLEGFVGGTSHYGTDGVVPYPWGAHYVPAPRREQRALCTLLGEMGAFSGVDAEGEPTPREDWLVREPDERLFFDGVWREGLYPREGSTPADEADWARLQAEIERYAALRDGRGRRAFDIPIEHGSDDPDITALDALSVDEWLTKLGVTSRRVRWFVEYACRDDYGLLAADTSAWAGVFYFASRLAGKGAEAAPLFAWPEGNGKLVRHLATAAEVRPNTLVIDVASGDEGAEVLAIDLARDEAVTYRCSRVIFAAPKFLATRVVRALRDRPPAWASAFSYGAWAVANVHVRAHPRSRGAPIAWDNVLYDSPSLGYVVATHQAMRDSGPTVLTYYYPYTDRDPHAGRARLLAAGQPDIADLVMSELGPAHLDFGPLVERVDVWRWGHAMVQPRRGFVWGPERRAAAEPVGRVHMAHSDLSGLALFEEALHHGVRAAEEVVAAIEPARAAAMTRLG